MKQLLPQHFRIQTGLLFILLSIALPIPGLAQYYISENILINDGLSNNYVHDLILDRKGQLWTATASGLNAYNGVSFTSYNVSNSALSANMINCLWYDGQSDYLWAGTKGDGVCRIHIELGKVEIINTTDSVLSNVLCITPSDDTHLWLISPKALMMLDTRTLQLSPINLGDVDQYFRCGVDDGNGNLILGSYMNGASVLNRRTRHLTPLTTLLDSEYRVNINCVKKDHAGRIWLATNVGLWYYLPGSAQLVQFEALGRRELFQIEEVQDHELWITSSHSVTVIDLNTQEAHPLKTEGELGLLSNIQCIYNDPYGNIWVGGQGNGLQFISHEPPLFRRIHNGPFWGIYEDNGTTWAGSRGHLYGFEGTRRVYDFDLTSHGYGAVLSICGNGHDLLYLAVPYHFLSINKQTGEIAVIKTEQGRDIEALTFFHEDDGTLWITATDGVYTLKDGHVTEMKAINNVLNRQSANGIRRDSQGKLWVATYENGLYLFDSNYRLISNLTRQSGFFSNSIQHLKFDSHGRLWMSTPDGACCVSDTEHPSQYRCFGYNEGLRDSYIRAIQEDQEGNIWMSTNNGISMLRYDEGSFVNYSQTDYIPVNNFNGGAVMQNDGGIVFTSMDGLCHCYPDSLTHARPSMHVELMSVVMRDTNEQGVAQRTIMPDSKGIYHFDHDHGSFRLVLGCQDYAHSKLLEFEYQMEDDSQTWIPCTRGIVTFRNLRPGAYNINVRARLKGQLWNNENTVHVTVCIEHPWWSGICARIIYTVVFFAIITILLLHYKHRLRLTAELDLERRRNMEEQARNTERLQFFTNITHELKTPLTLIQAPLEEMLRENRLHPADTHRLQLVIESTKRLTELCKKLLDFRRTETNNTHLKVSRGILGALVKEIGQSFVELNTNLNLQIIIETEENEEPILFDPDVIRSILTNLLSNALKYTPQGTIKLSVNQSIEAGQSITRISVTDTGYGIPAEALPHIFDRYFQAKSAHQASGTGIGLAIVKSMVSLHKGTIKVQSVEGQGTTVTFTLNNDEQYAEALHKPRISDLGGPDLSHPTCVNDVEAMTKPVVLLVEDDYPILNFMADTLATDYHVLQAHNGSEGVEIAFSQIPDIIITDLMMPVMDGNSLCRTLKADLRTSHIPVIMLTAKDTSDDQRQGYEDGADSYLTKPFSIQMLRSRLQNLLVARQRLAQWINSSGLNSLISSNNEIVPDKAECTPNVPTLSMVDQRFLNDIHDFVIAHIAEDNIRMEDLAQSLHISHSTLYRKIKAITGLTGTEYFRKVRILHCAELLHSGHCNVSEAAYQCGFNNLPYFRAAFKEVFGMTPSDYLKK